MDGVIYDTHDMDESGIRMIFYKIRVSKCNDAKLQHQRYVSKAPRSTSPICRLVLP